MNKAPYISVIVPNYNYARYLDLRIASILNQTYTDFELILLDDASTDNSVEILEKYKDNPHVSHILVNEKNSGSPFLQWIKGISLAQGKWIWIAEADDLCEPTFLETCMHYIEMYKNVSVCNVGSVYIDAEGNTIDECVYPWQKETNHPDAKCFNGKKFAECVLYWQNETRNASGIVFNRAYALKLQNKEWTKFRYCGDWLFWTLMAIQGQVVQVYQNLNYFRQHTSQTAKGQSSGQSAIEDFKVILYIEKNLPSIGYSKRKLRHGKEARKIRHIKNERVKKLVSKEYHKLFRSSKLKDYLYFKLHWHLKSLPYILTEEKDREKVTRYNYSL